MENELRDCTENIDLYKLLSTREDTRLRNLSLLREKALDVESEDAYYLLYEEACVWREKLKWAQVDRPYYLKQLLSRPVIVVDSVSQMKVCLWLKLVHGWKGRVKFCFAPPKLDEGVFGEITEMKRYAEKWVLNVQPNSHFELTHALASVNLKQAIAAEALAATETGARRFPDIGPQYGELAQRAKDCRRLIWVYRCAQRSIQTELDGVQI